MADYVMLKAFSEGSDVLQVVRRVPTSLEIDKDPGFTEKDVDLLVFFDESDKAVLVTPVLRGTLKVTFSTSRRVELNAKVRAFMLEGKTQWISFKVILALGAQSKVTFETIDFDEWKRIGGAGPVKFEDLRTVQFTFGQNIRLPRFALAAGLHFADSKDPFFQWVLDFNATVSGPAAIRFQSKRPVSKDRMSFSPFGLTIDGSEFPQEGHDPFYAKITVRQPQVDPEAEIRRWPVNQWIAEVDVPPRSAMERWNSAVVPPLVASLHTIQDGQAVSLVPNLTAAAPFKAAETWRATITLLDLKGGETIDDDEFVPQLPKQPPLPDSVAMIPRRLEPTVPLAVHASFPALRTSSVTGGTAGAPLLLDLTLHPRRGESPVESDLARHNEGFFFDLAHEATPVEQRVRVGALDLLFRKDSIVLDETDRGVAKVSFRPGPGGELPRVETFRLVTGRMGVRPGNQDPVPGEELNESSLAFSDPEYDRAFRRDTPVLVDRSGEPAADGDRLILDATESVIEHASQTIVMKLIERVASPAPLDMIVLDTNPFFVAAVRMQSLGGDAGSGLTSEVANWSNRGSGAIWEIGGAAEGFDLVLPPQGVGETMERRTGDYPENTPADFRFSPRALLKLRSSFFRQRFVEAPWNLRRVLGFPGQRAPGAGTNELHFEFLYGLSAKVTNRKLRVAELAARLGEIPGRQEPSLPWPATRKQADLYERYRNLWKKIYPSLLSRLGILEPYDEAEDGVLTLTDADGLSYSFRKPRKDSETAPPANPSLRDPIEPRQNPLENEFLFDPDGGLRGGWSWGFESGNILDAVLRTPASSSALLARPFFSALGGWGFQKASFDRNLSSIYSDTAMGRTFSISIERLGRISVFWNRAKHVIVYERTVLPSRQFAGEQDLLGGIPVLRKVREYVEILQHDRAYPEFGEAPIVRGFLRACAFPEGSRRINVNSSWGEDIGRIGWKVPLWKPGADPIVYPRPGITMKVGGDHPDKEPPLTLSEPDKLFFFTNTVKDSSPDSDNWPAVEGVDYPTLRDFVKPKPDFVSGAADHVKDSLPPAPVIAGNGGFTFALDASPHAANLVDARAEQAVAAILRNVTVIRGPLQSAAGNAVTLPFVRDLLADAMTKAQAQVPDDIKDVAAVAAEIVKQLKDAKKQYDDLVKPLNDNPALLCDRFCEQATQQIERLLDDTGVKRTAEELVAAWRSAGAVLDGEIARIRDTANKISQPQIDALKKARGTIVDEARITIRSVRAAGGNFPRAVIFAKAVVNDEATKIKTLLGELSAVIDTLQDWTETKKAELRKAVAKNRADILAILTRVERVTDDAGRAASGSLPDKARVVVRNLADATNRIAAQLNALVDKFELKPQDAKKAIDDAAKEIEDLRIKLHDALDALQKTIEDELKKLPLEQDVDGIAKAIDDAIAVIQAGVTQWDTWTAGLQKAIKALETNLEDEVRKHIEALRNTAEVRCRKICSEALASANEVQAAIDQYLANLADTLTKTFGGLNPAKSDFLDELNRIRAELDRRVADIARAVDATLHDATTSVERAFRLLRAFGDVPRVPGLNFDLPQIAYHFVDLQRLLDKLSPELPNVSLSPVIAKANELAGDLANALNAVQIHLPTIELSERLLPYNPSQFDLSSVFPDFAGMRLGGLFSNLRLPRLATDQVRITHGFDQQAMRGWAEVDADVPFDTDTTIFSVAGVTLRLNRARFTATSRIEAGAGQAPRQTFRGEISGDWELQVGGFEIVSLVSTSLRFDDAGNVRFDVSPDRVKLQAALQFISNLMENLGYSDSGFSILALPTGIRSTLDLPLPDIQGGSFGLSNLRLGCIFELNFREQPFDEFGIRTRFFVGSRLAPFTMTIFILGGAGWVDVQLLYVPQRTRSSDGAIVPFFSSKVSVGIMAAASLAIALGPIRGGVYAYFGITVEYEANSDSVSNLTVGLLLLFRGEVSLLGFLSVGLCLALEAQYTSGGGLIGQGHVSYSIKICWCVTINVSADVTYSFGGSGGQTALAAASAPTHEQAAKEHIGMFGG